MDRWFGQVAVLIPVKGFATAQLRLAPALDAERRAALAESMASTVVEAAADLPVAVVCDDGEVAGWATEQGAMVILTPGRGLNGAVEDGIASLAGRGAERVIVAHADLPLAHDLAALGSGTGVTLVPDRRDDGTNVICLPATASFRFAYGPGSFTRHRAEAQRLDLSITIVRDARLAFDVDGPDDLVGLHHVPR